jgi:hypothetical protein
VNLVHISEYGDTYIFLAWPLLFRMLTILFNEAILFSLLSAVFDLRA